MFHKEMLIIKLKNIIIESELINQIQFIEL